MSKCLSKIPPLFVIRIGIAAVFLWFGIDKFLNPLGWFGFVPQFVVDLNPLSPATFMYIQGAVQTTVGILLLIGLFTRIAAVIAAFVMLAVVLSVGFNDMGLRDFAIFTIAVSLALAKHDRLSVDSYLMKRKTAAK